MIVDRRRSVGVPPRCAGYVPRWLRRRVAFDDAAVLQTVEGIRLISPEGRTREVRAPGYILDRARFDKTLAIRALEMGADLANALVLRREGGRVQVRRGGLEADFEGEFILGADGPGSVIGRSIGQTNRLFMATLQYEVGLRTPETWSEFYRPLEDGEGYAWFVPCGQTARVGVGLRRFRARFLKHYLDRFLRRLAADGRIYAEAMLGCTGGLVPFNGPLASVQADGVLLAGDAGGMPDLFSGAGIATAVVSGEVAGEILGEALSGGRRGVVNAYGSEVRQRIPAGDRKPDACLEGLAERIECVAEWWG